MSGANTVHKRLCSELQNYICSQYFGKSPILLDALQTELAREGVLHQKPYIESSPAYQCIDNGILKTNLPDWMKAFFADLAAHHLGVYSAPFKHQLDALEAAHQGHDVFVATGTGSGKTECFIWPLLAKLVSEAREKPRQWSHRGIRTIIMYPMNALVSDQISRLRRLIGDSDNQFITSFQHYTFDDARRPQFGMYTGRTPYPGDEPKQSSDKELCKTLKRLTESQKDTSFFNKLQAEGKIPSKHNMSEYLERLSNGIHVPSEIDAELITRFEMQQYCPDILITNYSMLEYMLIRPTEAKIWEDTQRWLELSKDNKLLFIIDEAHMYRGASGGEVALLLKRLMHKLGVNRDKLQFILTTASMPNQTESDRESVISFANALTSAITDHGFTYLTGSRVTIPNCALKPISSEHFTRCSPELFENEETSLTALNAFWTDLKVNSVPFDSIKEAYNWLYHHVMDYAPFSMLIKSCRGEAVSLNELASTIFPELKREAALNAVSVMLAIVPLAKSSDGSVLFPARMHMLFRGIHGVYACTNEHCPHSHKSEHLSLGEVFLSEDEYTCPHCGSSVYELYNDRRCGALFYKAYVSADEFKQNSSVYLWHHQGQLHDIIMKELHLYIAPDNYLPPRNRGSHPIQPCYLDTKSGFLFINDDKMAGKPGFRTLYFCDYSAPARPSLITFPSCPHCHHQLGSMQLTSFSTKGNLAFYNLIKTQFNLQPAVPEKSGDLEHLPNEGRKVLLFSDSRQRAAKLARDMSEASDMGAVRQLFTLAVRDMMNDNSKEHSMDDVYDYFCLETVIHHLSLFSSDDLQFSEDCHKVKRDYDRALERHRIFSPRVTMQNASKPMKTHLLRMFCGAYNTLYDTATCWLEPTKECREDAIYELENYEIQVDDDSFLELFNAWMMDICDAYLALGNAISDDIRYEVRNCYNGYGLGDNWEFSQVIRETNGWKKNSEHAQIWKKVLSDTFLARSQDSQKFYIKLNSIKPQFDPSHVWYQCQQCSEITPYCLKSHCPRCGSEHILPFDQNARKSIEFWTRSIESALNNQPIRVIDTEEHTAQLSYRDQRDALWAKTERYELRFQDLIQEDESPVDILSSTTTMEVGIDIGSLVAVGLRNMPPMRENYQQRAGRAGRRGASLSTIVTFCENGPHDTLYFNHPEPMLRGDARRPWIDIQSDKLHRRHFSMLAITDFLSIRKQRIDELPAYQFLDQELTDFSQFLKTFDIGSIDSTISNIIGDFAEILIKELEQVKSKRIAHPELFGIIDGSQSNVENKPKPLLDALYEEGIIPTYSFPKNVVSTYITENGNDSSRPSIQIERGLDIAISEYAPGRSIVVDKKTYQIGGFYYPGAERKSGLHGNAASTYLDDPNYLKAIKKCDDCHWFGLASDDADCCPFCGNTKLKDALPMLIPWGFAPKNGKPISEALLQEQYSSVSMPLYSTVPPSDQSTYVPHCCHLRLATRKNQRIIMMNRGSSGVHNGFCVCHKCGAAVPNASGEALNYKKIKRPYSAHFLNRPCPHDEVDNVNLGYDFITDMLVLEFELDSSQINVERKNNLWLERSGQSFAEALRLAICQELDIEFSELITGYRIRTRANRCFVDIYIYDSLSSGAGYAVSLSGQVESLLTRVSTILSQCSCDNACYNCLMHYRNQNIHGMLDRFAALQLLKWGQSAELAPEIDQSKQVGFVRSIETILSNSGLNLRYANDGIYISRNNIEKRLIVYPAMWKIPNDSSVVYVRDIDLRFAKPSAIQQIIGSI